MNVKIEKIIELRDECYSCTKCPLHKGDQRVKSPHVFGRGNINATIMVVGQNPGYNETVKKKPFIGPAGINFDRFLKEIGLERRQVYITNTVKCYTTGNRAPQPHEVSSCKSILKREVELIKPKVIVALGNYALRYFTGKMGMSQVHGQLIRSEEFDVDVFPMYHPSPMNMNKSKIVNLTKIDFSKLKEHLEKV